MLLKLLIENKNEVVPRKRYYNLFGVTTFIPLPAQLIILFLTSGNTLKRTAGIRNTFIRYESRI